jgi:NAD(P)-dependent dehydrogenase (short-subunit alcohol dehydrogenase family)
MLTQAWDPKSADRYFRSVTESGDQEIGKEDFSAPPFDGLKAYARAKRGQVMLAEHWASAYADTGVEFFSMHPGWAATPGVRRSLPGFYRKLRPFLRDARMGADTMVWLASSPEVRGYSGAFFRDRRPRPKAVLPGTGHSLADSHALATWLRARSGVWGAR